MTNSQRNALVVGVLAAALCLAQAKNASVQTSVPSESPESSKVQPLSPKEILDKSRQGILLLETSDGEGGGGSQGTGFLIDSRGYVATNFHVIRDACHIQASAGKQTFSSVKVVHVDPIQDIAILKVEGLSGTALVLGSADDLSPGSRVVAIGHPLADMVGREVTISDGIYSGPTDFGENRIMMRITAPVSPGNSGGPLFDERGHVVGITTLALAYIKMGAQNMNFAIPIDVVRRMELSKETRTPAEVCHEYAGQEAAPMAASDPKDDRVALATFKQRASMIISSIRAGAMVKESDRAPLTEPPAKPPSEAVTGNIGYRGGGESFYPSKYSFDLTWYSTSAESTFNVYSVDPQLSIVTTFMGYVEMPLRTYRQRVVVVSEEPGVCDGKYFRECLELGGTIKKEKPPRESESRTVWGLSYQEGRWEVRRVFGPTEVRAFLESVTKSDRDRIYRAIVGPGR
jgi:S1-C subfamily serine protease